MLMAKEMHPDPVPVLRADRIGENCLGCRTRELEGRDAIAALEVLIERALIVEADSRCDLGQCQGTTKVTTSHAETDLGQVGMRRESDCPLEKPDELEGR